MELTYTLAPDDYRQCLKAYRNRRFLRRWFWRLMWVATIVFVALPLGALILHNRQAYLQLRPLGFVGMLWAIVFIGGPRRMGNKLINGNPGAREPRTVEISDAGINSRTSINETKLAWPSIVGWSEGPKVFTLFLSPISFFPVPKRAMTDVQQQEFRALLKQHVKTQ